jgi:hypothetical protein
MLVKRGTEVLRLLTAIPICSTFIMYANYKKFLMSSDLRKKEL